MSAVSTLLEILGCTAGWVLRLRTDVCVSTLLEILALDFMEIDNEEREGFNPS